MGKKIRHRGAELKARDIFDIALVTEREPASLRALAPVLKAQREVVLRRLRDRKAALREDFAQLDVLEYTPSYHHCVRRVRALFAKAA